MSSGRIGAVILAAGQSRRMGDANKLLTLWHGKPLLCHALDLFQGRGLPMLLVTGHDAEAVAALARPFGCKIVHNPGHEEGMGRSLAAGIAAVPPEWDAALIALGDMPLIRSETVRALLTARTENACILAPEMGARIGHPVLWPRAFFEELTQLRGDKGAREIIDRHADRLHTVPVDDPGIFRDFDQPDAFAP